MKRFHHDRIFLFIGAGIASMVALWFWWNAWRKWDNALAGFTQVSSDLKRLEQRRPYPNEANLKQARILADEYEIALSNLKSDLKRYASSAQALAPNEFQSQLRVAATAAVEKARIQKVPIPEKFYLGFGEFASRLPTEGAAALLGQELVQVKWLFDLLIDAGIDSLVSFRRTSLPEELEKGCGDVTEDPNAALIQRSVIEVTFRSTPAAVRAVVNQVATADNDFFIICLLRVRNEQEKGPARETVSGPAGDSNVKFAGATAGSLDARRGWLRFIVGDERIETTATLEIVRFCL